MGNMKRTLALVVIALAAGAASLVAGGPVPGDVMVTRALQAMLGTEPSWAEFLTRTAKVPLVGGALVLGAGLAALPGGWRVALAVPLAYGFVWLADKALRAALFVPKPDADADLVAVASLSTASGLPSTFALVYASLFGAVFWLPGKGVAMTAARIAAALLILAGCSARIVLGGHWTSQMIASVAVGILAAGAAVWVVRQALPAPSLQT